MIRVAVRVLACAATIAATACAVIATATPATRPDQVQVYEPAGIPDRWTFRPGALAVAAGTAVTFVNHGRELHTVTSSDDGRPFDLILGSGATGEITFDHAGTFAYHCGIHPQMTGIVRVCDGGCG